MSNFRGKCFSENSILFLLNLNFQLETPCPQNQLKIQIEKEKNRVFGKNIFPENLKKSQFFRLIFSENLKKISIFFEKNMFCFWESYRCCSKTATRAYQNLLARIACHRNSDAHKKSPDISYENKRSSGEKRTFFEILQIFLLKIEDASEKIRKNQKRLENLGNFVPKQILMMNTWINHKPAIMSVRPHLGYQTIRIC